MITVGASGIGRAIALKFAVNGASVRILDLNYDQAQSVSQEIARAGGTASAYVCKVTIR